MTTASLQSLRHPLLHHQHNRHSFSYPLDSPLFLRPTTSQRPFPNLSSPFTTTSSLLTPTTTTTSSSFDTLAHHLAAADFRLADEETRRILIDLAGEAAQKRGYVFFSEVQFISAADLRAIDRLWRRHSRGRFGYSVQRRVWEKSRRDFTGFFIRVGWMKRLDTEMEQYNYRAFPDEFMWELGDGTPEGHLPLTNALRGTQLLATILTHPAFDGDEEKGGEEGTDDDDDDDNDDIQSLEGRERPKPSLIISSNRSLKPDYSF